MDYTIEELNKKFNTSYTGKESYFIISCGHWDDENKTVHRMFVKCGSKYFEKNFQILDKGEIATMVFSESLF